MVKSCVVSIVFVFLGVGVVLANKCKIWQVKHLQGCFMILLSDIKCLRKTYRGLKDALTFNAVSPDLGHPSSFTICS